MRISQGRATRTWLLCSLVAAGTHIATADEEQHQGPAVFPLPEILVTARPVEAPTTLIVREVGVADIEALNAHTGGEALRQVPGVNIQYGGSSGDARAWIRGFRDRDTLVLFDGVPIASPFEGTIDLNEISVGNLANIRIIKSAPSVTYGVNGMAGVIDFIPRTNFDDGALNARLELGDNDRELFSANYASSLSSVDYFVSGAYQSADDYELSDNFDGALNQPPGRRVNSDFDRKSLFLYLHSDESPLGESSFFYNFSDADRGVIPQAGTEDPDFERLKESRRQTLAFSNRLKGIPLAYKLFYTRNDSELAVYTDATYREIDEIERAEDYAYGGMVYSTLQTSENNSLVLHASYNRDTYKAEDVLESGDKAELDTYNLSAENQYWINSKLSVAIGGIYTWFSQEQSGNELTAFNPQLVAAYQLNPSLSFRASAAQRTRFPRLRELYRNRYGNPDLDEQTADNYELSVEYQFNPHLSADLALFRSDVDGLIERPTRRDLYQNLDKTTLEGVEAAAGGWLTDSFFGRLSYTYVDAAEDLPGGGDRQLRSRPKNTAMAEARLRLPYNILWSVNSTYISDLYDVDDEGDYVKISSFFVADTRISISAFEDATIYLAIANITDKNYQHKLGYPREGRSFSAGVEVSL